MSLMKASLKEIGVENVTIKVNHRGIFNRFLAKLQVQEKSEDILRTVDKLAKVGVDAVVQELTEICGSEENAKLILDYIQKKSCFTETLSHIEEMAGGKAEDSERISKIYSMMQETGIADSFELDPSITRGLD